MKLTLFRRLLLFVLSFSQSEFPAVSLCHAKQTLPRNLANPHGILALIVNGLHRLFFSCFSVPVKMHCVRSFDENISTKQVKAHLASKC